MTDNRKDVPSYQDLLDDLISFQCTEVEELKVDNTLDDVVMKDDVEALCSWLVSHPEVNVNTRSPSTGRALLHQASAEGRKEIVKYLVKRTDASLSLRTMLGGCSPLHLAVTNDHRSIVFQLLSHGADVLARDKFGCSPMHYVSSLSVAKLLLQYGGLVLDSNLKRKTAYESVRVHIQHEIDNEITKNKDPPSDDLIASRQALLKYLKLQAEREYKMKLAKLRELKAQSKGSAKPL